MNKMAVVMLALLAAMRAGEIRAADFEASVAQAGAEVAQLAKGSQARTNEPEETRTSGAPLASGLYCAFTFQDGQKLNMDVPVLFNSASKSLAPIEKTQAAGDLTIVMFSTTGEGTGGPGFIRLSIVGSGHVIYSAFWKAGDFVTYAGQRAGVQEINTAFGDAAIPEMRFSCETK
ncbi:MAG: hypothetical protein ACHQ49_10485 [Elusimicrobiota bacterium]